jgi:phytoene dehydrogenase-like protein
VIVGGGHNGLVAAGYLARAGRSCVLLERRAELGGAAVSGRVFAGIDARLSRYAYLVSLLPRAIPAELGLRTRLARRPVASYTPDPRAGARRGLLIDRADRAASEGSFAALTGGHAEFAAWERFQALMSRLAGSVLPTLTEPLRSRSQLRALVGDDEVWRAVFERPLEEAVSSAFADDLVRGVVLTDALVGTFAAAHDRGLLQNRCFLYHVLGGEWLVPVGGMGALTAALADAARRAGAELRTDSEVLSVEPDRRGAVVRLRDGAGERSVDARRVLVNAAPAELERLLGRGCPADGRPEGSQLKLNMLLSRLPRLRDRAVAPERAFAGTFHVNELASQLQHAYRQSLAGRIPELPPCEAYCHSLTDASILGPELRASGAHTLSVFALHMPARLFEGDPAGARDAAVAATMRSLDSVLAEPLEDCLLLTPEGRPCLEAHTPLELERELRLPGGHIFHRDLAWPFAEREHEVGTWGVETEHHSILLCGAGARRGGCVSGIPGRNAAMAVLAAGALPTARRWPRLARLLSLRS